MADPLQLPAGDPGGLSTDPLQLPDSDPGGLNGQRQTGQRVDSASGKYYLEPKLITRPRASGQHRPISDAAKSEEIATLVVGGMIYEDWETVWFQWTLGDEYAQFRFTATEDDPRLPNSVLLRFTVGDECKLYLGGYPIMRGVILIRQVAYDGKNHTIVLQGVSLTYYAGGASIISEKSEWEGDFLDVAGQVLAPTASGYKIWGAISRLPYKPPIRNEQGETIFAFLERIGRSRKVIVTSDPYGDFLFIGEHNAEYVGDLVEGGNILKCQAIIADMKARSEFRARGQVAGSDEQRGKEAAEQDAVVPGTAKYYMPLLTPIEHPVWTRAEVELRARHEHMFNEGQGKIEATVTVQGWFNPRTGLRWDVGQKVRFVSPMTGIDNMIMKIRTVTFTQDKGGSLTTMVITQPSGYNDSDFTRGRTGTTPDAKSDVGPARNPPVQMPYMTRQQGEEDPTGGGQIQTPG